MSNVSRMLGGGLLAAGVAGVVSVGVALLAANQGLLLDEAAFPRIAHRWTFHIFNTAFLHPLQLKLSQSGATTKISGMGQPRTS